MSEVNITRELLETSVREHHDFMKMVCLNKYGYEDVKDVIEGVINYCNIEDEKQKELLRSGKFIPAGSILSMCNSNNSKGSFSNCYFIPIERDSIEAIFECQKRVARTYSYRGGCGVDLSVLRPCGEKVNNAAKASSGAVSFMPSFSELTKTIAQCGRRGALIITLDIRHPDALKFIWSKAKPENVFETDVFTGDYPKIDSANISLKISDSFMQAVEEDEDFTFCFPDIDADKDKYNSEWDGDYDKWFENGGKFKEYETVKAKDVLEHISQASWMCGDPGISFVNTTQNDTFGTYIHESLKPIGLNPCGEQALAAYNNCLLGSFVLHRYVDNPFSELAEFDWASFEKDVGVATRIMNIFSDINESKHPLIEQRESDAFGKRIGIEQTGIGDTFAMLGYIYGDSMSEALINEVTNALLLRAMYESTVIAQETSPCNALKDVEDRKNFIHKLEKNPWIGLSEDLKSEIIAHGMRNTSFNTFGPTGSISIISDNCTSGIEPIFKFAYKRMNRIDNIEYEFIHLLACKHMLDNFEEFESLLLTKAKEKLCYIEADEISPKDRVKIQAAIQEYTDASISSTINLPNDCKKEDIYNIYIDAWRNKLKGITVFRDGSKVGVLSASGPTDTTKSEVTESILIEKELLPVEKAERHCVMWQRSKVYINISLDEDDPIEVFTKLPISAGYDKDGYFNNVLWMERTSNWDSLCRMISMCLRFGLPIEDVIKQLENSSYSMVDAASILVRVLNKYVKNDSMSYEECPDCGKKALINEGGCEKCIDCGFSRCG